MPMNKWTGASCYDLKYTKEEFRVSWLLIHSSLTSPTPLEKGGISPTGQEKNIQFFCCLYFLHAKSILFKAQGS